MNFLQIQDFLEVAKHKSITKAARSLCVTQQTLSGHMAALEEELGCRLFQRRPKFCLTYAGERFYRYACQITETRKAMEQEFLDIRKETRGILRAGIGNIRGKAWMPAVLPAYRKKFPEMEIVVSEGANEVLIKKLLADELDMILAYIPEQMPEFYTEELYQEKMLLTASRRHLTEEQQKAFLSGNLHLLPDCCFLMNPEDDNAGRVGRQFLRQKGILPKINITAYSSEILLHLCLQGEGLCFCPDFMARTVLTRQQQEELLCCPAGGPYPVSLAWQRGQYVPRPILDFRDVCFSVKEDVLALADEV